MNITCSGVGTVTPGIYISGTARFTGPITCDELRVSGSASAEGSLTCLGTIKISGAFKTYGFVTAKNVHISGAFRSEDELKIAEKLHISGGASLQKSVKATELHISGGVTSQGDMEAEEAKISGHIQCDGLLNAEKIHICHDGRSHIRSVGGADIEIRTENSTGHGGFLDRLLNRVTASLFEINEFVEGDTVYLEKVKVPVVRGKDIVIGPGCQVGSVQYSGTLSVDPNATVGESVQD